MLATAWQHAPIQPCQPDWSSPAQAGHNGDSLVAPATRTATLRDRKVPVLRYVTGRRVWHFEQQQLGSSASLGTKVGTRWAGWLAPEPYWSASLARGDADSLMRSRSIEAPRQTRCPNAKLAAQSQGIRLAAHVVLKYGTECSCRSVPYTPPRIPLRLPVRVPVLIPADTGNPMHGRSRRQCPC